MSVWFTSDTHFNHAKIIQHCNRPFMDAETMNAALVAYWRETVKDGDPVYFLGDFCLGRDKVALEILAKLPGWKVLVSGNHDTPRIKASHLWGRVVDYFELASPTESGFPKIVMCHYPFAVWNGSHRGSINLHGHSHGTFKTTSTRQIDVGVDCHDYKPVSLDGIMGIIAAQEMTCHVYTPLDHHGEHVNDKLP